MLPVLWHWQRLEARQALTVLGRNQFDPRFVQTFIISLWLIQ